MKNLTAICLILFVSLFILPSILHAQKSRQKEVEPCFKVTDSTDFDFGKVFQYEVLRHTFTYHNSCADTVVIGSAKSGCGCTVAVVSNMVVPPDSSARIEIKFRPPRGQQTRLGKTVSVYLRNGDAHPFSVLRVFAEIVSNISVTPRKQEYADIRVGKEQLLHIEVANTGADTLAVTDVQPVLYLNPAHKENFTDYEHTEIRPVVIDQSKFTLAPGEEKTVAVRFTPGYEGSLHGAISFEAERESNQVLIEGNVIKGK